MEAHSFGKRFVNFYMKRYQELAGIKTPENCLPLKEMMEYLTKLPDEVYELYGFSREPLRGKICTEERGKLLETCRKEGKELAEALKKDFPDQTPLEMAARLGIRVSYPEFPIGGGRVLFAEFEEPDKMRIYRNTLERAKRAVKEYEMDESFAEISIENVLAAHELFHYMEMKYADTIFSRNYRLQLWRIGSFRYTSGVAALSELAAMSFAKTLSELPFSPWLLDVFLAYSYQKEAGEILYQEIREIAENMGKK